MGKNKAKSSRKSKRRSHDIPDSSVFDPKASYDQCINHLEQLYHEACSVSGTKAADIFQLICGFIRMIRNNHKRNAILPRASLSKQIKTTTAPISAKKATEVEIRSHAPMITSSSPNTPLVDNQNIQEHTINLLREAIKNINRPCSRTFERFANSDRKITIDSLTTTLEEMELSVTPHQAGSIIAHYDYNNSGMLDLAKFTALYHANLSQATVSNPGDTNIPKKENTIAVDHTTSEETILLKQIERILTRDPVPLSQTYHKICGMMGEARVTAEILHEALHGNYGFECDQIVLASAVARYDKTTWGLSKSEFVRMLSHAKLS